MEAIFVTLAPSRRRAGTRHKSYDLVTCASRSRKTASFVINSCCFVQLLYSSLDEVQSYVAVLSFYQCVNRVQLVVNFGDDLEMMWLKEVGLSTRSVLCSNSFLCQLPLHTCNARSILSSRHLCHRCIIVANCIQCHALIYFSDLILSLAKFSDDQ